MYGMAKRLAIPVAWFPVERTIRVATSSVLEGTYYLILDGTDEGFFRKSGEGWILVRKGRVLMFRTLVKLLERADAIILGDE